MILRQALAALLLTALVAPSVSSAGQSTGTATGSIVGSVRDATGAVLPNVTVTVSSDALMGPRTTLTNAEGRYRIVALPPGEYSLSFALAGYRTLEHKATRVSLGFTATIDVTLAVAMLAEDVTVRARGGVLDRQSTGITGTFDSRRLADLPSSRSMFALLALSPAVEVARIEVGGSSGAAGAPYAAYGTRGFNRPMVEGISVTGIFPTGFTLDYGSFEEVSVLTASHGADWPTPGVHMQFISKSGGNRYRGTLYADYENRRWQSFNIDEGQISRGVQGGGGLSPQDVNRLWDYYDVNGDVGGFVIRDKLWWYSSIREQEVSARLVNFPVTPHRTRLTNYSGKVTYAVTANNKFIAFAQAGRNHQPNRLDPFSPTGSRLTPASAINESEESTANQRALGWVWKGEWNSVVDDRLLLEVRMGQFGGDQRWEPNSVMPRLEDVATLRVRGGNRDWERGLRRDQLHGALNYFHEGWSGGHHLKIGGEVFRTIEGETWRTAYPGNVLHVLQNNTPIEVYLFQTPSRSESGLWTYSAYASDSWRLNNRLTLNLGVRFDRYRVFLPAQEHPAGNPAAQRFAAVDNLIDWNLIVPRMGAVYDPTGRGKTLVKVSYGQYRLPPGTELGFNVNPNSNVWWERSEWRDVDGSGIWESGEEFHLLGTRGGVAIESLDADLELPVVNEIAGWIERELPAAIGLRTGVVWRRDYQHFARQNANQPFDAFTIPVAVRDPGPDGLGGTADDGPALRTYDLGPEFAALPPINIVRNVPGSSSHYWTWEIAASRRSHGRWTFGAGFAHTWHRDQAAGYSGQAVRNNTYPVTPNDLINAGTGGPHEFTTWTAKAYGTYDAPWGLRVTPVLRHQSGQPFGRTFVTAAPTYGTIRVLAEPVGTRRMDNVTIVDVRVEKRIRLHDNWRLAPFVDVFNLLNGNPEQNSIWSSGASFLRPVTIVPPRIARIGAKLEW